MPLFIYKLNKSAPPNNTFTTGRHENWNFDPTPIKVFTDDQKDIARKTVIELNQLLGGAELVTGSVDDEKKDMAAKMYSFDDEYIHRRQYFLVNDPRDIVSIKRKIKQKLMENGIMII